MLTSTCSFYAQLAAVAQNVGVDGRQPSRPEVLVVSRASHVQRCSEPSIQRDRVAAAHASNCVPPGRCTCLQHRATS